MLNPDGSIKSVILSEFGFSSTQGELNQAASLVYSYIQASKDECIDAFLYTREIDVGLNLRDGLADGLKHINGVKKLSWDWFCTLGTSNEQSVFNEAMKIYNN